MCIFFWGGGGGEVVLDDDGVLLTWFVEVPVACHVGVLEGGALLMCVVDVVVWENGGVLSMCVVWENGGVLLTLFVGGNGGASL